MQWDDTPLILKRECDCSSSGLAEVETGAVTSRDPAAWLPLRHQVQRRDARLCTDVRMRGTRQPRRHGALLCPRWESPVLQGDGLWRVKWLLLGDAGAGYWTAESIGGRSSQKCELEGA